ncbi:hypothetical protein KIN20_023398 [Parelaphostrongylus tenuis]|uniref:C2H2-type domain-containing protein n=1 Tax=Parelaphostrongylus tenuis TaxID=148309 RepID=A0AAD5MWV3_PARTN|nr:hypothetical protein KIN20_023398 [Parelaphostrongylus tenuis]
MDVTSLRLLVEEVITKKNSVHPLRADYGISPNALCPGKSTRTLEMPIDPSSPLARTCNICAILVHRNHLPQHEALHSATTENGLRLLDLQSLAGGYFCDLCGIAFRSRDNLYAHWRSSCAEIMANIEPGLELYLSDLELKAMVLDLLWRLRTVSRQAPLIAKKDSLEEMIPSEDCETTRDRSSHSSSLRTPESGKEPVLSSGDDEGKAIVYMDDYMNPADTVVDVDGELVNVISVDRGKWSIPENGKPLQCPDCFRQFANAGRLERHIAGFHSHYGAFKCPLCGHSFKYDYNLLYHYRHSCAYTKLLVGADVRKLLDAASLRKLVSHIKQSDPRLRPGRARLVNIKRRPSLRAVPRNIRALNTNTSNGTQKHLNEGIRCPVCGVVFYGQKSLDKHIGTVHLLNLNFLEKAITRENASPRSTCEATEARNVSLTSASKLPSEHDSTEEEDKPPVLEVEGPGEVPAAPTRCVDVNGEDIHDFDAEQLSELDVMFQKGELSVGDLVITSEDVQYRVSVGTHHGSQIVLERISPSDALRKKENVLIKPMVEDVSDRMPSLNSSHKVEIPDANLSKHRTRQLRDESERGEVVLEYAEEERSPLYVDQENVEGQYEAGQLHCEMDDSEEHDKRPIILLATEGEHFLEYFDDETSQCDGFVQYINDENGHHIIEFIEDGADIVQYLNTGDADDSEVMALLKSQTSSSAGSRISSPKLIISDTHESEGMLYIMFVIVRFSLDSFLFMSLFRTTTRLLF